MRKKILSALFVVLFAVPLHAAGEKLSCSTKSGDVQVEFYAPGIVRVTKLPAGGEFTRQGMVVTAEPEEVALRKGKNSLSSGVLSVSVDPATGNLTFRDAKGKVLLCEKKNEFIERTDGPDKGAYRVAQTFILDKDEPIYGLGTIHDNKLDRRNGHFLLEQANVNDYQNVIQSVKGWGLFWDNYSRTNFDDDADGMTFSSEVGDGIDYYFMYGGGVDGVVAQMRQLSGDVPMFPLWTYGYWQSKERYKSSRELLQVLDTYRSLEVPLDGIIQDWQYWGSNYNWNAMEFLAEEYLDGKQMIERVHEQNAHIMISIWASFGPMTKPYKELDAKGLLYDFQTWPQSGLTQWPPRMDYPSGVRVYDALSQEARDIYWNNLKRLYDDGIDAWWMDSTDPDFFNPQDEHYDHAAGDGTWRRYRNAFPLASVAGVYDSQRKETDQKRVFILTRSAFAGQQRYGANMWSGDVTSSWEMLRAQIPAGLSFTIAGNPNFNSDIGGFFCSSYNTKGPGSAPKNPQFQELYVRWMQFALFCPMFRSHGADAPREIWQFGQKGDAAYDAIEKAIRFRYRLLPYIYSTSWQVTSNNESFMRPLVSDFAADRNVWTMADEFMFGRSILAAPIVEAQYTAEKIVREDAMSGWDRKEVKDDGAGAVDFSAVKQAQKYLPKGAKWYDFWTGEVYKGGQTITLETTFDCVPMFIRAGSILPLGPEMQYVTEKKWDNLELRVYPGADGEFTLYEDEGDNYNYEKGVYSTIRFSWDDSKRTLTFGERSGEYPGMLESRKFTVVLPDGTTEVVDYDGTAKTVKL